MNHSTLLVFLCVFALSEVLLAAKLDHSRGVAAMKNLRGMRRVRSDNCLPTDSQCDEMCKFHGANSGKAVVPFNWEHPPTYCECAGQQEPRTEESCVHGCNILGFGGGKVKAGGTTCSCNKPSC